VLRQRVITALVLAPLAIAVIYLTRGPWFAGLIGTVAALGAWEWIALAGVRNPVARLLLTALWVAVPVAVWAAGVVPLAAATWPWLAVVAWLAATAVVLAYPASGAVLRLPVIALPLGFAVLWCALAGAVALRSLPGGGHWLLGTLALVWAADIGAYFAGRRFGRHKLAPAVSPGKTWEGVAGGAAAALVAGALALAATGRIGSFWWGALAVIVALSVVGDLFESVVKRTVGVKDSGTLLPGHGGVLDRIDGVLPALPFAAAVLTIWSS
jgi:phosphatidate cytidylyltransferase